MKKSGADVLVAVFCAPLYFLMRRKWADFFVSGFLFLLEIGFGMVGGGRTLRRAGALHAVSDLVMDMHEEGREQQAELIAEAVSAATKARGSV